MTDRVRSAGRPLAVLMALSALTGCVDKSYAPGGAGRGEQQPPPANLKELKPFKPSGKDDRDPGRTSSAKI